MELPDPGRLLSLGPPALRALGERLREIGLGPGFASKLARVGERLDDALRAPMRTWHARRLKDPAAVAARLFLLHDPVEPADAHEALGDLAPLRAAGFVEDGDGGLVSRVHVALVAGIPCFGDVPGTPDAVMPSCGATMDLVRATMPASPVESVLDLGCGAGAVALLLSRAARRVMATDVDPRAALFTRLNAALHGVGNVEVRVGDLYAPVAGERYDRIVSQPPFVARAAGERRSTFVHGGARGDELLLRVLAEAAEHLTSGGQAVVLGDWPLLDGSPIDERVRAAVGPGRSDVMVLQAPCKNLDEYCAQHAAVEHGELGAAFSRAAIALREHLDGLGLRGIAMACVVIAPGAGWTSLVQVRHGHDGPVTAETIERMRAARALALGPREHLARATLRTTPGARVVEQTMPGGEPPSVVVHPPAGRPEWPAVLDADTAARIARLAATGSLASALGPAGGDEDAVTEAAREGLLRGVLEIG